MAGFDTTFAASISSLLTDLGQTVTLSRVDQSYYDPIEGTYGAETTTTYTSVGIIQDIVPGTYRFDNSGVQAADRFITMAASGLGTTPRPKDRISINSTSYNIIAVNETNPSGTALLYEIQVRL